MKIVKNYYDAKKAELDIIVQEYEKEEKNKSPKELTADSAETQQAYEQLMTHMKELEQKTQFIPNEQKANNFDFLYKGALYAAKQLNLNIEINTENVHHSTISLTTGGLLLDKSIPENARIIIGFLFIYADETWIDHKNGLIRLLFFFHVNDRAISPK